MYLLPYTLFTACFESLRFVYSVFFYFYTKANLHQSDMSKSLEGMKKGLQGITRAVKAVAISVV